MTYRGYNGVSIADVFLDFPSTIEWTPAANAGDASKRPNVDCDETTAVALGNTRDRNPIRKYLRPRTAVPRGTGLAATHRMPHLRRNRTPCTSHWESTAPRARYIADARPVARRPRTDNGGQAGGPGTHDNRVSRARRSVEIARLTPTCNRSSATEEQWHTPACGNDSYWKSREIVSSMPAQLHPLAAAAVIV